MTPITRKSLNYVDANKKRLKAESLQINLRSEKNFFKLPSNKSATATRVSFKISKEIAAAGKSFPGRGFIKNCMLSAVSLICQSEIKKFQNASLSRITIQRRIKDIANNITEQLRQKPM